MKLGVAIIWTISKEILLSQQPAWRNSDILAPISRFVYGFYTSNPHTFPVGYPEATH